MIVKDSDQFTLMKWIEHLYRCHRKYEIFFEFIFKGISIIYNKKNNNNQK